MINDLSQKLIRVLRKAVAVSFFKSMTKTRKDLHLLESLVGVAGNKDTSVEQIKAKKTIKL